MLVRYLPLWVALLLGIGIIYSISIGNKPSHLFKEGRLFTQLSGQLLLFTGFVCLHIFSLRKREMGPQRANGKSNWYHGIWIIMGLSFIYLFLDEVACFHEKIGDLIQYYTPEKGLMEERYDSVVVGSYGVLAVLTLAIFHREVLHFRTYWHYYFWASLLFCSMVICDFLTEDKQILELVFTKESWVDGTFLFLEMFEDYSKILAIAIYFRGFLAIRYDLKNGNLRSRVKT